MKKTHSVLIVENHPLIVSAYVNAFNCIMEEDHSIRFDWEIATNCDEANEKIDNISIDKGFDIVLLDMKLPPSIDHEFMSGQDLGVKINQLMPAPKIVVSTGCNDEQKISDILSSLDPDGFMIKDDIRPENLILAIKTVIMEPPFYSRSVLQFLRKKKTNNIALDKIGRVFV